MFNSSVLDVAIGLVFIYLLLGLMCTTVNEWIAQVFNMRANTLKEGIRRLLNAPPDGTWLIRPVDINMAALAQRLIDPADKLTLALGPLDASDRDLLTQYANASRDKPATAPPAALLSKLVDGLNTALAQPDLVRKIDDSKVSAETKAQYQKQLKEKDVLRLNRLLLHEAYPVEISGLSDVFYDHPLIKSLARRGDHPSYIPAATFAYVLIDIFSKGRDLTTPGQDAVASIHAAINDLPDSDVKRSLQALLRTADSDLASVQKKLETWFDSSMDRVSGWYKKKTQICTIVVATVITVVANADTLRIAQQLMINPTLREKIVQNAGARRAQGINVEYTDPTDPIPTAPMIGATPNESNGATLTMQEKADLSSLTGWSQEFAVFHGLEAARRNRTPSEIAVARQDQTFPGTDLLTSGVFFSWIWTTIPVHLLGWVLTAIAVSLGAPFWFDLLNKFMNIRSAGTAPGEKNRDKSKV